MYDEVLVATDGSEPAERAVEHAVEICRSFEACLHVVHAVSPRLFELLSTDSVKRKLEEATESGESIVEEVADAARTKDVEVVTHVEQRIPHVAIAEYVEENDVNLVVVGSRGRSEKGIGDRLLGSVSTKVVYTSDVPVLTVH